MATKTITYSVGKDGVIEPTAVQDAGVQGDHRKTAVKFVFASDLYAYLSEKANYGKLVYRFDGYDGSGGVHHSDTAVLTETSVTYPLENFLTRYGGLVKATLIISLVDSATGVALEELVSVSAQLRLIFSPHSNCNAEGECQSLSSLSQMAKDSAEKATAAATEAKEAYEGIKICEALFKEDTTFIFDGGDLSGEIDVDAALDDEMSEYSNNAVKNKIIKQYVDKTTHPVGSVWVGGKDAEGNRINPADLFGGVWTVIDKEFISQSLVDKGTGTLFEKTDYTKSYEVWAINSGHTIRLRISFVPTVVFEDSPHIELGKINLSALGVSSLHQSLLSIVLQGDAGNGSVMASITADGVVTVIDTVKQNVTENPDSTVGAALYINEGITILQDKMLDAFCNKFYWLRTE